MTGIDRRGDTPMEPPWPQDVLADLNAGVFDLTESERLWSRVRRDADALAVLRALDAVRTDLTALAAGPDIPMPAHVVTRLDAALAAEAATTFGTPPPAPVVDLAAVRRRRDRRRLGWATGALVAAAAVAVAVLTIPHGTTTAGQAGGVPTGSAGTPLTSGDLNGTTLAAAIGRSDYGPLTDPTRRAACLAANGQAGVTPAGATQVVLNGRPGVLMVLTTGQLARYRLLVVGPDCAAGTPDRLADTVIGGVPIPPTR